MSKIYFYADPIDPNAQAFKQEAIRLFGQTKPAKANVAVVIGGDGTLLNFFHKTLYWYGLPAFGVKASAKSKGFLLNEQPDGAKNPSWLLEDIAQSYKTTIRPLHVRGEAIDGKVFEDIAINDVVVSHARAEQTIDTIVSIDGEAYPHKIRGDGMLVSTFLGSTGYNASAMGVIPPYGKNVMLITPLVSMPVMTGNFLPQQRWPCLVHISCLSPDWRRASLSADNRTLSKKIAEVDISQANGITATILHAPHLTFEQKFMDARKMIARKRAALFAALQAG